MTVVASSGFTKVSARTQLRMVCDDINRTQERKRIAQGKVLALEVVKYTMEH